ncbi:MAG: glycosyltransferase family 39 protein [Dehalococcoidia bacterium]
MLATAALVRFYNLGVSSLWYDEGFSAFVASEPPLELLAHTARDIHPPLYYLLLHGWTEFAGQSDFSLGFFSLAFGLLCVSLVLAIGRRWFGETAGLLAGLAAALSPFQVWYSQEVRMYTLAAFLGLLLVAATERGSWRDFWTFVLAGAAGLYVLYYLAFLLVALNVIMGIWLLVNRRLPGGWTLRRWSLAQALILVLYLPWLPVAIRQAVAPAVPSWREGSPAATIALDAFGALLLGQTPERSVAVVLLGAGLVVIALLAGRDGRLRRPVLLAAGSVLLPVALIGVVSLASPLYHPRYVFPFSLGFVLLLGLGLARIGALAPALRAVATIALAVSFAGALQAYHVDDRTAPDDYRAAVAYLAERWHPGDAILVNAGYLYAPLVHYWPGDLAWRGRLTESAPLGAGVIVYQTGTIDGPASLGGGDPRADFYPVSWADTEAGLRRIATRYARVWVLRGYDTVTDPKGQIRGWLSENGRPFEDVLFRGSSNIRVQGYLVGQPAAPNPVSSDAAIEVSTTIADPSAMAGDRLGVALAWKVAAPVDRMVRAYLALVDDDGRIWAQQDDPAVGTTWRPEYWQPGRWTADPRWFRIPAGTPPGRYRVELGAYLVGANPIAFAGSQSGRLPIGVVTIGRATGLADPAYDVRIDRDLAPGLRLAGVRFGQFEAREGDTLDVALYWRTRRDGPDGAPALRLVLSDGSVVTETGDALHDGRYPPTAWKLGELVRDPRELTIPAGASGVARLEVAADGNWVTIADVAIEGRQRRYDVPPGGQAVGARFGTVAELVSAQLTGGAPGSVNLVWRATGRTETSYTVFVQAIDSTGQVVGQTDRPPLGGAAPTTGWLPGEVLVDDVPLPLRAGAMPGTYQVIAGLYDPKTGARLSLSGGGNYVDLGVIRLG